MVPEPDPEAESTDAAAPTPSGVIGNAFRSGYHARESWGLEFDRVANFCDAVFAIAMTLIAATIAVPSVVDASTDADMVEHLRDSIPTIVMFFIAFVIIGRYWMANHYFFALLKAVNARFVAAVLIYLAFVAFLPFPSALMGRFASNPVAVSLFAVTMAAVSAMETVLIWRAYKDGLYAVPLTAELARWNLVGSASPVVFFLASVPVMFLSTWAGMVVWALAWPWGLVLDRYRPGTQSDVGQSDVGRSAQL